MLIRRVIDHHFGEHANAAAVRLGQEQPEVLDLAVRRMDAGVVGDVVAIVLPRRRVRTATARCA